MGFTTLKECLRLNTTKLKSPKALQYHWEHRGIFVVSLIIKQLDIQIPTSAS